MNQKNLDRIDLLGHLPAKKAKIIIAAVLMTAMVFMWVKVLFGENTKDAKGVVLGSADARNQSAKPDEKPVVKISYVQLPVVPGRNDVLAKDIFTSQNWIAFDWGDGENAGNVEIVSPDENGRQMHENNIRQIAERVTVDAISADQSGKIQAFIQDDVVSIGSKLTVEHNGYAYEFIVIEIQTDKVVLGWKNCTVTLQIAPLQ